MIQPTKEQEDRARAVWCEMAEADPPKPCTCKECGRHIVLIAQALAEEYERGRKGEMEEGIPEGRDQRARTKQEL